jgi:hypothetical protein
VSYNPKSYSGILNNVGFFSALKSGEIKKAYSTNYPILLTFRLNCEVRKTPFHPISTIPRPRLDLELYRYVIKKKEKQFYPV